MYYIVDTAKTFDQAATDLEAAVKRNGFGVLHVHDLGGTLRGKGIDFPEQCKVFEVCNPGQAAKVMATDMRCPPGVIRCRNGARDAINSTSACSVAATSRAKPPSSIAPGASASGPTLR